MAATTTTRACLVALLTALFLFLDQSATAAAGRRSSVHRLLERLNKPALATIESPDGDTIDCVHISKQPAFDHPLLKNHVIQMKPSYHPAGGLYNESSTPQPIIQTWHQNGRCPENTIPIRRIKEEDVMTSSSVRRYGKKRSRSIPKLMSIDDPDVGVLKGHEYGVAFASGVDNNYYGTQMTINVWQPKIERATDFSLAQLWITGGSYEDEDLNTIEAGWQVYPEMYGDQNTRLFIYWTRDGYQNTGCYNLKCSGFVQTNNEVAIGGSISSPVSVYGGSQHDISFLIWKDGESGNWWLHLGGQDVGYWPSSIFTHLQADSASSVSWGGEVASPDTAAGQTSTQMGSGHFPAEGSGKAAYIRNLQVVDSSNTLRSVDAVSLEAEQPNCYDVQSGTNSNWGTYIFFGGPGKNPNCP